MAVMMRNLYQAPRESGATEDSAQRAADEVADFTRQVSYTKGEFANVRAEFANTRAEFQAVKTEFAIVKTMLGVVIALALALVVKLFTP